MSKLNRLVGSVAEGKPVVLRGCRGNLQGPTGLNDVAMNQRTKFSRQKVRGGNDFAMMRQEPCWIWSDAIQSPGTIPSNGEMVAMIGNPIANTMIRPAVKKYAAWIKGVMTLFPSSTK